MSVGSDFQWSYSPEDGGNAIKEEGSDKWSVSICNKLYHWKTANVTVNFVTLQNHSLLYDFRATKIKQSFLTTDIRF